MYVVLFLCWVLRDMKHARAFTRGLHENGVHTTFNILFPSSSSVELRTRYRCTMPPKKAGKKKKGGAPKQEEDDDWEALLEAESQVEQVKPVDDAPKEEEDKKEEPAGDAPAEDAAAAFLAAQGIDVGGDDGEKKDTKKKKKKKKGHGGGGDSKPDEKVRPMCVGVGVRGYELHVSCGGGCFTIVPDWQSG